VEATTSDGRVDSLKQGQGAAGPASRGTAVGIIHIDKLLASWRLEKH
jgi:hypothetical protein